MKCRPSVPQPLPSYRGDYVQYKYSVLLRIPYTSYTYPLPPTLNFTNYFHKEKQAGRSPVLNIYTNRPHVNLTCFNSNNPFTAEPFPYFFFFFFASSAQFLSGNKLILCVTAVSYIQTTHTKNYLTKYLSEGNYFVYILNFK